MSHTQFNRDTRVELAVLLNARKSQVDCARILGIDRSNVCLEINRNKDADGVYRGGHAHKRYLERRRRAKEPERKIANDRRLRRHIVRALKKYWSPEQIAGRLKRVTGKTIVSHETIYTFVYEKRPDLVKYLRHQKSQYRKKRGSRARMKLNRATKVRSIDERPNIVDQRSRVGDWEDDTVVGKEKKQRIWTCVERKSGYALADKFETVSADAIQKNAATRFKQIPKELRRTLTRDNGIEFGDYDQTLERTTGMKVYRAHAYSSNERASNENWNGLLRQFFPKGTPFATITPYQVQQAVRLLNDRPRKRLGYRTPREVFRGCCDSD
jgi:transposase, IS30 family